MRRDAVNAAVNAKSARPVSAPLHHLRTDGVLDRTKAPATDVRSRASKPVGGVAKRAFDIVSSLIAIIALAPVFVTVAILIKLESPGPVIFVQRRGGLGGVTFPIYKFRSMTTTDDDPSRIQQVTAGDARVTRIGRFLRKSSIDELPQLLNVLFGHMSLVGPRPHPLAIDKECVAVEPDYLRRSSARPGITGLAQVSGSRGPMRTPDDIRERIRLDMAYCSGWTLWMDIWIVARTSLLVFGDRQTIR